MGHVVPLYPRAATTASEREKRRITWRRVYRQLVAQLSSAPSLSHYVCFRTATATIDSYNRIHRLRHTRVVQALVCTREPRVDAMGPSRPGKAAIYHEVSSLCIGAHGATTTTRCSRVYRGKQPSLRFYRRGAAVVLLLLPPVYRRAGNNKFTF